MAKNMTSEIYAQLRMAAYSESARVAPHIDERWMQLLETIMFETVPTFTDEELQASLRASIESEGTPAPPTVERKNRALAKILQLIEDHHKEDDMQENQKEP